MKLAQLLEQLFKTPYKQKRAMVLWKKGYQKHLIARAKKWEKCNIKANNILNNYET